MEIETLADLGWSDFFAAQLNEGETAGRINAIHRDRVDVLTPTGPLRLVTPAETGTYAVGDWVTYEGSTVTRLLDRRTLLRRGAAGEVTKGQLIAANVDTVGIVTSCNDDFNPARLERYLTLCTAGGARPLIILTKADLADDPESYRLRAESLSPLVTAITLNALDADAVAPLAAWCGPGQTLGLVGSSGVGKTTIQNHLTGLSEATQGIREDDAKGRHTTTARALRQTLAGGWLIDTPGMRELRLNEAAEGIDTVFADLTELAAQCKFSDCQHQNEPGCAIRAAVEAGTIDTDRIARWEKLQREDRQQTESIKDARKRARSLNKTIKRATTRKNFNRGNWDD